MKKSIHIVAHQPPMEQGIQPQIPRILKDSLKYLCPHCGNISARIGAGRKPQEASLHCSECKRFIAWVSVSELKAMGKGGEV